ncbi:hypothetical protein M0812_19922 [Anaeramoeba flamelloides]|uniref:Uncharacterized protein n=1 Tax=Anaeramoeba flamelloides TaxID=1746091 RepID=A0AAV7Z2Q1_9EUKA|nr:hypothetical protein M0812_19922 [Anaeramoeba flamelloides]
MSDNLEREVLGQCGFEFENKNLLIMLISLGKTTFFELYDLTSQKVYCTKPIGKEIRETNVTRVFNSFTTSPTTTIISTPKTNKDEYLIELGLEEFILKSRELKKDDEITFKIGSIQIEIDKFQEQKQKEIMLLDDELNVLEKKHFKKEKKLELTRNELLRVEEKLTSQEQKFLKQEKQEKQEDEKKKKKNRHLTKKNRRIEIQQKKQIKQLQTKIEYEQKKLNKQKEVRQKILKEGEKDNFITDELLKTTLNQLKKKQKFLQKLKRDNQKSQRLITKRSDKNKHKIDQLLIKKNVADEKIHNLEKELEKLTVLENTIKSEKSENSDSSSSSSSSLSSTSSVITD